MYLWLRIQYQRTILYWCQIWIRAIQICRSSCAQWEILQQLSSEWVLLNKKMLSQSSLIWCSKKNRHVSPPLCKETTETESNKILNKNLHVWQPRKSVRKETSRWWDSSRASYLWLYHKMLERLTSSLNLMNFKSSSTVRSLKNNKIKNNRNRWSILNLHKAIWFRKTALESQKLPIPKRNKASAPAAKRSPRPQEAI